ncbi:hypothetical protein Trydic_g5991 [Trypoxylus dichotomus]
MTMTKKQQEDLRIQQKILRLIPGPIKTDTNEYRHRTKCKVAKELEGIDVVAKWRAGDRTTIYNTLQGEPEGRKTRGRIRTTCLQMVKRDLGRAGVYGWQEESVDTFEKT